ncbi:uncharacterized protein LOC144153296 [Haemaphysalis longicornis]
MSHTRADGEECGSEYPSEFPSRRSSLSTTRRSSREKPSRSEESGPPSTGGHAASESLVDLGASKAAPANSGELVGGKAREPQPSSSTVDVGVPKAAAVVAAVAVTEEAPKPTAALSGATITTEPPPASGVLAGDEHASPAPVDSQLAPAEPSEFRAVNSDDAEERHRGASMSRASSTNVSGAAGIKQAKKRRASFKADPSPLALQPHQRYRTRASNEWTSRVTHDLSCVLLLSAGVVIVLVVWLAIKGQKPDINVGTGERYCHTQDCTRHAQLISTSLNESVDPCEDFNAFACSALEPCHRCEGSSYGSALAARALHDWFSDFRETLESGKGHLRAGAKALAMFDACMAPTGKDDAHVGKQMLRDLMAKLRIPWPDEPDPGVDPLRVLVKLSYRRETRSAIVIVVIIMNVY